MTVEQQTFLFADLVGFTALTEAYGDEYAADLAQRFCRELNARLPDGAEDFKMLGDACLVRVDDASAAVLLALRLAGELGAEPPLPAVRVGMHTGAAVRRGHDWFGMAVNVAARIVELAASDEVLLSEATRVAAGAVKGVEYEDLGMQELRNVTNPHRLCRALSGGRAAREERWALDPVCRVRVEPGRRATTLRHRGVEYVFCSSLCAGAFARAPERYQHRRAAGRRLQVGTPSG